MDEETMIGIGAGCLMIAILVAFILFPAVHFSSLGDGTHTGYITAVEQEGYIYQNYRVYVKTDNSSSQEDVYCMKEDKKDLAEKLGEARDNRTLTEVHYSGVRGFGYDLCASYEVTGIN